MQGPSLEERVREPRLARHVLLESIRPLQMWLRAQLVTQGLSLEERVREPLLARHALLESIPPLRMWLRAQIVGLVFILLLPVRHLLAPVLAVALVVILPQQGPLPAALARGALKDAIIRPRVRLPLALARPVRQGSLVTILRCQCLDPQIWPSRQKHSVPRSMVHMGMHLTLMIWTPTLFQRVVISITTLDSCTTATQGAHPPVATRIRA